MEVLRLADHRVKVRCLAAEVLRLAAEVRRLAAEVRRIANCDVPCLPLGVRVLRFRCGLLLGPC